MSGKNYINKLKLERERSTLKVFMFVKKIPLMHVKIGKYLKLTTNNQMSYNKEPYPKYLVPTFEKREDILHIFHTISIT